MPRVHESAGALAIVGGFALAFALPSTAGDWPRYGGSDLATNHVPAAAAGLSSETVADLETRWSVNVGEQHGRHLGVRRRHDRSRHRASLDGDGERLRLRPRLRLSRRDLRLRRGRGRARCGSQRHGVQSPADVAVIEDSGFGAAPLLFQPPGCPPLAAANAKNGNVYFWSRQDLAAGPLWSARVGPGELGASFFAQPSYSPELGMFFISALPSTR